MTPSPAVSKSGETATQPKRQSKAAWGAMLAGAALSTYGWTRKSISGAAIGVAGGAIALKAASAGPIADLVGTETTTQRSVTIMRPAAEIYAFWKDIQKTPQWMERITCIKNIDDRRWSYRRVGMGVREWTTQIIEDVPNRIIAWHTIGGQGRDHDVFGRVEFREIGAIRGTQVTLTLRSKMRPGLLLPSAATIVGPDPAREIVENLRRLKMLMEAGEIATIQGQPHGPRSLKGKVVETASELLSFSASKRHNDRLLPGRSGTESSRFGSTNSQAKSLGA